MSALIASSVIRTCLGNGAATFSAMLEGRSGIGKLRCANSAKLNVTRGYRFAEDDTEEWSGPSNWLSACVQEALTEAKIDPTRQRTVAIVGSGLRQLRMVELAALGQLEVSAEQLHFASAVKNVSPEIKEVITLSNACSAGGHALAIAQDLIEQGEADAVIAAGVDTMTESMLAIIGRVSDQPTTQVRPFDAARTGTLLGEGAAAVVVVPEVTSRRSLARLLSTGLSCDARHETAPDFEGIQRAMRDALYRAAVNPAEIDLIVAHGTGTILNDPTEARLIRDVFAANGPGPWITAVKGAVGHTSGTSALINVDVAIRCLHTGLIPPIVGLYNLLNEGAGLRFIIGQPTSASLRRVGINSFGFGGVNAMTLLEAPL